MTIYKRQIITHRGYAEKDNPTLYQRSQDPQRQTGRPVPPVAVPAGHIGEGFAELREAGAVIQKIRMSAQRELALAKQIRAEAEKYYREVGTKARSQAQQLILNTRLATQKEFEELQKEIEEIRKVSAEVQKASADIWMMRMTAQEELETQRKFTSAARIKALSLALKEEAKGPVKKKKKKQPACKK